MGQLTNQYVSSSFQGLLKMTDSTQGLTNTLQTIQTGDGDNSPLQMSFTEVNISGSFYINNVPITNGTNGTSGTSGSSGSNGTDGSSGSSGSDGSDGSSGTSGTDGSTGSSGSDGTSGTSGSNGTDGTSGSNGSDGTSGTDGSNGTDGTSGTNGSSGTSGDSLFALTGSVWNTTNNVGITGSLDINGTTKITGSLNVSGSGQYDINLNGQMLISNMDTNTTRAPRIFLSGSGGNTTINRSSIATTNTTFTAQLNPSATFAFKNATSDEIGFTVNSGSVSGWTKGPAIYTNDPTDNFPAMIGFQDKARYTDGRITLLKNTDISGSLDITGTYYVNGVPFSGGTSGTSGTDGSSGSSGTDGSSGTSGSNGTDGTSGSNGTDGTSGSNGTDGTSGSNGTDGTSGSNGTDGTSGSSGTDGTSGSNGTDGTSGTSSSIDTGSFATTGSNTFIGNQTIEGNIYTDIAGNSVILVSENCVIDLPSGSNNTIIGNPGPLNGALDNTFIFGANGAKVLTGSTSNIALLRPTSIQGSLIVSGSEEVIGVIQATDIPMGPQYFAPTVFQGVGQTAVAYDQFVNGGNFDSLHIESNLNSGSKFQDYDLTNNNLNTYLQIPTNTGNNPSPQFTRGLGITGSLNVNGNTTITGSLRVSGSNTIIGNTVMTGSLTISGSQNIDLIVTGAAKVVNSTGLIELTMLPNSFNVNSTKSTLAASGYIYGPTGSDAQFYLGVYDEPNLTTDVELNIKVDSSNGISFKDWDNVTAGDYIPFMNVAPNLGNNPTPQFTRGIGITGSLNVSGNVMFASGSNKTMGTVALDGGNPGTVTVSNSLVTTSSMIFLTKQTNNHPNAGPVVVSSKGTGTFTITSNHNGDADTVAYQIINPA